MRLRLRAILKYSLKGLVLVVVFLLGRMWLAALVPSEADILTIRRHTTQTPTTQAYIPDDPGMAPIGQPANIPQKFMIEEADACRRREGVQAVAYVHSAISRVTQRAITRKTWANSTALNMAVVFMVGRAKDHEEENIIQSESEKYHDIVQGDYGDHYKLLSYKGLAALYWVTRYCAHVPWTIHADDDIMIDPFLLVNRLHALQHSHALHCHTINAKVMRSGRWEVQMAELPDERYPKYCQGIFWFMKTADVPKLLAATRYVNYLWVDDVYITGFLPKAANINVKRLRLKMAANPFTEMNVGKQLVWYHTKAKRVEIWTDIMAHYRNSPRAAESTTRGS